MSLMPRRSTERIAAEFLPSQAEQEWITKFRPRSTDTILVNIARSCCDGFRPTNDESQCCLNVLSRSINERDWKAEVLATWILGFVKSSFAFSEEAQHHLIQLAAPRGLSYKRTLETLNETIAFSSRYTLLIGAFLGLTPALMWMGEMSVIYKLMILIIGSFVGGMAGAFVGMILTPFLFPMMAVYRKRQERQIQKAAFHTLRRWNNPRFLGTIAHASIKANRDTLSQIHATFAALQTQLTTNHYGVMPAGTTDDLCRALEASHDFLKPYKLTDSTGLIPMSHVLFVQDLLRALEKVGNGQSAKYVRALIEADRHEYVTSLAQQVLTTLHEREQEETARTTLLRHSAPPVSAEELLRAASPNSTENDTETLIRPVL